MFKVDEEKCVGCGNCEYVCPAQAISMVAEKAKINANKCADCGACVQVCPHEAIYPETGEAQQSSPTPGTQIPNTGFGMGKGMGRGLGRGMGRGLGIGPRDGRGGGKGGGGRR